MGRARGMGMGVGAEVRRVVVVVRTVMERDIEVATRRRPCRVARL